jgi:RNA polymerase-binding transcription factor
MPDQSLVALLRVELAVEAERLREQIAKIDSGDGVLSFDENFADSGQVAAEQGENKVMVSKFREQLTEVEHALAKFEAGTYGQCERCGDRIGEARLEIMPATRYCINHA